MIMMSLWRTAGPWLIKINLKHQHWVITHNITLLMTSTLTDGSFSCWTSRQKLECLCVCVCVCLCLPVCLSVCLYAWLPACLSALLCIKRTVMEGISWWLSFISIPRSDLLGNGGGGGPWWKALDVQKHTTTVQWCAWNFTTLKVIIQTFHWLSLKNGTHPPTSSSSK